MATIVPTIQLTPQERQAFETAQRVGYLIRQQTRRTNLENAWWEWCEARRRAWVEVVEARRYATIRLDLLPADRQFTPAGLERLRTLLVAAPVRRGGHDPLFGNEGASIYDVPIASAPALAQALAELGNDPRLAAPRDQLA